MSDKIYAPIFTKEIETKFGKMLKQSFNADKMITFIKENVNEKGYVNLNTSERRETGQYGDTHYSTLDTWEPDKRDEDENSQNPMPF